MLSPTQLEQVRIGLLRHLQDNNVRWGLATTILRAYIAAEGFAVDVAAIEQELDYLRDKGLVENVAKSISPELRAWRITAAGRDHLAQQP